MSLHGGIPFGREPLLNSIGGTWARCLWCIKQLSEEPQVVVSMGALAE
ncbi:hypothetical protein IG631_15681 [Alternaria alternata]|nr:hypothetical protein IG631_15681 [Alternaria alternata]